jgi:hypothetical protein
MGMGATVAAGLSTVQRRKVTPAAARPYHARFVEPLRFW